MKREIRVRLGFWAGVLFGAGVAFGAPLGQYLFMIIAGALFG